MLSQYLVPSIIKKINSSSLVLGKQPPSPSNTKILIKVFQCILKSIKTFLFKTISTVMPKNKNQTKKPRQILI